MVIDSEQMDPRPVLRESEEAGIAVIALLGDWDFAQAAELRAWFDALVSR